MNSSMSSIQAPAAVIMVRPQHFQPNPQTAADNAFQRTEPGRDGVELAAAAYAEVTQAAATLARHGVRVHLFDDDGSRNTPDSVFPNNWLSTHPGGHVALYPMYSPNRRRERRADIVEMLKAEYRVQEVIDYSGLEADGVFLEGTGAMVLDHAMRVAYVTRSRRADDLALERFCTRFHYEPLAFDTADASGCAVYHTNVMMCIATEFALVGLDFVSDSRQRTDVQRRLAECGREVIALNAWQVGEFAGNALELSSPQGRLLAMSRRAANSLEAPQLEAIERSATIVALQVPTIELAGGSVRCMLAGVHLAPR